MTITSSSVLAQDLQYIDGHFVVEFLPDRLLTVAALEGGKTVTVLGLRSGVPQLTIDTSIEVYGLRPVVNSIVVIGDEKAITWNLSGGNSLPDARINDEGSPRGERFRDLDRDYTFVSAASISLDLQYLVLARFNTQANFLDVYRTSTGQTMGGEMRCGLDKEDTTSGAPLTTKRRCSQLHRIPWTIPGL